MTDRKICCQMNVDDYEWTKKVMETCFDHCEPRFHGMMDGLSLHYYTLPEVEDDWNKKEVQQTSRRRFLPDLKRGVISWTNSSTATVRLWIE